MKFIGGAFMMICLSSNVLAGCQEHAGSIVCRDTSLTQINQSGYVSLMNVKVESSTTVDGMINIKGSHLKGPVSVKGSINLDHSILDQRTSVTGSFTSDHSQMQDIVVTANEANFNHSKLRSVLVRTTSIKDQKLYLKGSTVIAGNVTFESGKGQVFLDPQARINGEVIGGKIVK